MSMTREDHLLLILGEECAGVGVHVSKALRFGLSDIEPGQPFTTRERLVKKIQQVLGMVDMLNREGIITMPMNDDEIRAKQEKVEWHLDESWELRRLDD